MESLRYIFGPLPSRRLGRSLGVDVIPRKTCTLDCVYCELGPTDKRALRRKEYVPLAAVIEEVRTALSAPERIDTITFSGSGEPTLNSSLGTMIHRIKGLTRIPVAVLTNGTLLYLPEVRKDLMEADIVLPSLDAATAKVFERINRPHPRLHLDTIVEGIKIFRKEYRGQLWLEILFVKDVNDVDEEVSALKRLVDEISPDKIQLNTVVRPPAMTDALPVSRSALARICAFLGPKCEIIGAAEEDESVLLKPPDLNRVLTLLRHRPMTLTELGTSFDAPLGTVKRMLEDLERQELIHSYEFDGKHFFEATQIPA